MSDALPAHHRTEADARLELAAVCRLMHRFGLSDLTSTHLSTTIPERPGHYLLNPYGMLSDEVTASSVVEIDAHDRPVRDGAASVNRTAIAIHGAIHRARPDVTTAIHAHTHAGIAVGALPQGLLPLSQWALKSHGRTAWHAYDGAARAASLGEAIVADLGEASVMFLRNHGTLAVGRTTAEAWIRLYYLEQACRAQLLLPAGAAPVLPPDDVCRRAGDEQNAGTMQADGTLLPMGGREWPALIRLLDRTEPGWRD
jgi:ribulose-5-phosphate 4-epimerase/fuculose-1-phosphate aldolase